MIWLWVILISTATGGIIGFLSSRKKRDAFIGATAFGMGCTYLIFRIFLIWIGLFILLKIGNWLFR